MGEGGIIRVPGGGDPAVTRRSPAQSEARLPPAAPPTPGEGEQVPSLFMLTSKHFFSRQARHWFLCVLSTGQPPCNTASRRAGGRGPGDGKQRPHPAGPQRPPRGGGRHGGGRPWVRRGGRTGRAGPGRTGPGRGAWPRGGAGRAAFSTRDSDGGAAPSGRPGVCPPRRHSPPPEPSSPQGCGRRARGGGDVPGGWGGEAGWGTRRPASARDPHGWGEAAWQLDLSAAGASVGGRGGGNRGPRGNAG